MTDKELIAFIIRYCKKNNIKVLRKGKSLIYDIIYSAITYRSEPLILVIDIEKNSLHNITSKSRIITFRPWAELFKFISLSDVIKQERAKKLTVLLKK
jgi:hypothetical protein